MDSDPEPRSAASTPSLATAQVDDPPEEPPSPFQSAAIVLGPLIAALTLAVPFGSVVADRLGTPQRPGLQPKAELLGELPPAPLTGAARN